VEDLREEASYTQNKESNMKEEQEALLQKQTKDMAEYICKITGTEDDITKTTIHTYIGIQLQMYKIQAGINDTIESNRKAMAHV